jgi:hypothetical protein
MEISKDQDYEMFSKAGNTAITTQLKKIISFIEKGKGITPDSIDDKYEEMCKKVEVKHREVYDTEPRYHIRFLIKKCLEENFYDPKLFF